MSVNVNGLPPSIAPTSRHQRFKADVLDRLRGSCAADIVCLQETHLVPADPGLRCLSDMALVARGDSAGPGRRGGTAIFASPDLLCDPLTLRRFADIDACAARFFSPDQAALPLVVACV